MQAHNPQLEATVDASHSTRHLTPGALAGPGSHLTVLDALPTDWERIMGREDSYADRVVTRDDTAYVSGQHNVGVWSPCGRLVVAYVPEKDPQPDPDDAIPDGVLWLVHAYRHAMDSRPAWTATFERDTPAELVAAFCNAFVSTYQVGITRHPGSPASMLSPPATS